LILKIFIIGPGGILCYSKNFFEQFDIDDGIISGFLTAISNFAREIKGGEIKALTFKKFNLIYSYSIEYNCIFVIVIDKDDLWEIAWHYAFNERISEISGTEFNTSNYDNLLFKPKALLEYFRESRQGISYEKYKAVFGQVTNGIEYMGPAMPIDHLLIRDNKVYGRFMVQGKPCQLEMPYPDPNELLEALKKQKIIKSIKKLENGVTVIRLKETVNLLFEKQEYNEALHNLIMGVKNERSHNATE